MFSVSYFVANAYFALMNLLLELSVLQHLGVDTKSLLEEWHEQSDGATCSQIDSSSGHEGEVSRIMIARPNRLLTSDTPHDQSLDDSRFRVNYL